MSYHYKSEEYYTKFMELQEKLRKSEEERLKLEMKFNEMVQQSREEEQQYYRKLRFQYKSFLEEDKTRTERNEKILQTLERIEVRISMLSAKTDRFKLLRKQYQAFLDRIYHVKSRELENYNSKLKDLCPPRDPRDPVDRVLRTDNDLLEKYMQSKHIPKYQDYESIERNQYNKYQATLPPDIDNSHPSSHNEFYAMRSSRSMADDILATLASRKTTRDSNPAVYDGYEEDLKRIKEAQNEYTHDSFIKDQPNMFDRRHVGDYANNQNQPYLEEKIGRVNNTHGDFDRNQKTGQQYKGNLTDQYTSCQDGTNLGKLLQRNINFDSEFNTDQKRIESYPKSSINNSSIQDISRNDHKLQETIPLVVSAPKNTYHVPNEEKHNPDADNSRNLQLRGNVNTSIYGNIVAGKHLKPTPTGEDSEELGLPTETINKIKESKLKEVNPMMTDNGRNTETIEEPNTTTINETDPSEIKNDLPLGYGMEKNRKEQSLVLERKQSLLGDKCINDMKIEQPSQQFDEHVQPIQQLDATAKNGNDQAAQQKYNENIEHYGANEQLFGNSYEGDSQEIQRLDATEQPMGQLIENSQPKLNDAINVESIPQFEQNDQVHDENGQFIQHHNEPDKLIQYYGDNGQHNPPIDHNGVSVDNQANIDQSISQYGNSDQTFQQNDENGQKIPQFDENAHEKVLTDESVQPMEHYDGTGQPIPQYNENSPQMIQYDENGHPILQYDENGQAYQNYDEHSQPIAQYDENDKLIPQYDENGLPYPQYDEHGQPFPQYNEKHQPMLDYDQNGQQIVQYDESGQPLLQYDESGQPLLQYDESGQPLLQYDERGQPLLQYDESGQPLLQYDESGQPLLQYDESGQPLLQYDESGQPLSQYDEKDQPYSEYGANDEGQQFLQYDENGQPIQQYDVHYDENGQPIQYLDENGQPLQSFAYDGQDYGENNQQLDENGQPIQQCEVNSFPIEPDQNYEESSNASLLQNATANPDIDKLSNINVGNPIGDSSESNVMQELRASTGDSVPDNDQNELQKEETNITADKRSNNLMDMLDTDTESAREDTKVSNESDFDFSNG